MRRTIPCKSYGVLSVPQQLAPRLAARSMQLTIDLIALGWRKSDQSHLSCTIGPPLIMVLSASYGVHHQLLKLALILAKRKTQSSAGLDAWDFQKSSKIRQGYSSRGLLNWLATRVCRTQAPCTAESRVFANQFGRLKCLSSLKAGNTYQAPYRTIAVAGGPWRNAGAAIADGRSIYAI